MGWFLVICGVLAMAGGTQISSQNAWAATLCFVAWVAGCVAVIGLGVAINQGWQS